MKIEDIFAEWEKDCQFNRTELGEESLRTPSLHHKYYKMYSAERLSLRKLEVEYRELYKIKYEYYSGSLDYETLSENKWEPFPLKILKTDIQTYIDSDKDITNMVLRIALYKEKIDVLESIIKNIQTRGFAIKNALDWEKFKNGV